MKRARRQDEDEEYIPTPEEEAGIGELDRGEVVTMDEFSANCDSSACPRETKPTG